MVHEYTVFLCRRTPEATSPTMMPTVILIPRTKRPYRFKFARRISDRQVLNMLSCSRSKPPQRIYRRELLSQLIPAGCGFLRYHHSGEVPQNLRKTCHDMINRSGILNPWLPSYPWLFSPPRRLVGIVD